MNDVILEGGKYQHQKALEVLEKTKEVEKSIVREKVPVYYANSTKISHYVFRRISEKITTKKRRAK